MFEDAMFIFQMLTKVKNHLGAKSKPLELGKQKKYMVINDRTENSLVHSRGIEVSLDPDFLVVGISPRDVIDEFYVRTFPKCRDLYCHKNDDVKVSISIYAEMLQASTSDTGAAPRDSRGTDLLMPQNFSPLGLMNRLSLRSAGTLPVSARKKDISQPLSCTDAVYSLKVALLSNTLHFNRSDRRQGNANVDLFSATRYILPAPHVENLAEHMFITLWGAELLTPRLLARVANSFRPLGAERLNDDSRNQCLTQELHELSPLLTWKVKIQPQYEDLLYPLQLYRFHHFLNSILGIQLLSTLFQDTECPCFRKGAIGKISQPKTTESSQDIEWQKRRMIGEIKATMTDIIEAVEFASNSTNSLAVGKLMDKYSLLKSPPASPRYSYGSLEIVNGADSNDCKCEIISENKLSALRQIIPCCSNHILRNNMSSTDLICSVSVVICQGLLSGDSAVSTIKFIICGWLSFVSTLGLAGKQSNVQTITLSRKGPRI